MTQFDQETLAAAVAALRELDAQQLAEAAEREAKAFAEATSSPQAPQVDQAK